MARQQTPDEGATGSTQVAARGTRRRFTVDSKASIVQQGATCRAPVEIGVLLRRESATLAQRLNRTVCGAIVSSPSSLPHTVIAAAFRRRRICTSAMRIWGSSDRCRDRGSAIPTYLPSRSSRRPNTRLRIRSDPAAVLARQQATMHRAYQPHPGRFVHGPPRIPALPDALRTRRCGQPSVTPPHDASDTVPPSQLVGASDQPLSSMRKPCTGAEPTFSVVCVSAGW